MVLRQIGAGLASIIIIANLIGQFQDSVKFCKESGKNLERIWEKNGLVHETIWVPVVELVCAHTTSI